MLYESGTGDEVWTSTSKHSKGHCYIGEAKNFDFNESNGNITHTGNYAQTGSHSASGGYTGNVTGNLTGDLIGDTDCTGDFRLASSKVLKVNNVQVVGAQQAYIANATGGTAIDAEARTTLDSILTAMKAHGLIASV